MQTTQTETSSDLMAIWRATGGTAWTSRARPELAGDDGLRAATYSNDIQACGPDDGLRQAMHTAADPTFCM
jgi:hypothetical protein